MSKMNSTSLYVTTNQIILKSDPNDPSTWQDLYRLLPYLRNSLCCVVCGSLLITPISPNSGKCQHHLCKNCTGGKKKIKPACVWCKDCETYVENKQLRTLLQCYKKMCAYLWSSNIYKLLVEAEKAPSSGVECGAGNLLLLIREGAMFQDEYESNVGLSKDVYSILPCIYTNSSTQTLQNVDPTKTVVINQKNTNGSPLYSVMYTGAGNKITIKRKSKESLVEKNLKKEPADKVLFKKPLTKCNVKLRRGCRCGNATATPGKLTCCGQRCPCYVDSKACVDCKCRGCRNPHTPDGNKILNISHVVPHFKDTGGGVAQLTKQQQAMAATDALAYSGDQGQTHPLQASQEVSVYPHVKIELDANLTIEQLNEHLISEVLDSSLNFPKVYLSELAKRLLLLYDS